jgi:hypothetical protein
MVRPFRFRLALALLAAEEVDRAVALVRTALGAQGADPEMVEQYLQRLVYDLAGTAVTIDRVRRVNAALCPEFPTFCESPGHPETQPQ